MAPGEPEVRYFHSMPAGYVFVPKGDVYITKNCRQKTHERGQTVYVVVDKHNKPLGLRCPRSVFSAVEAAHRVTAAKRADAVERRDAAVRGRFEEAVRRVFPHMPPNAVARVVEHALKKRSGRVGRAETVSLEHKAKLAVWAHIRHCYTDYDRLLREGEDRLKARKIIGKDVSKVSTRWGGPPMGTQSSKKERKRGEAVTSKSGKKETARRGGVAKRVVAVHRAPRVQTRRMRRVSAALPNGGPDEPIEILDSEDSAFSVVDEYSGSEERGPNSGEEIFSVSDKNSNWSDSDD